LGARDVYVLASLYGDASESVNDRLCRLLFFVGAMHTGGTEDPNWGPRASGTCDVEP
jgi:hypothetical protein